MLDNSTLLQIEMSVLGAVLLRPENLAVLPDLEWRDFANLKPRAVYAAMRNLEAKGTPIDVTTIGDEITRTGQIDAVGWDFLGQCVLSVPTIDNAIHYAKMLKDYGLRRRLLEKLGEVLEFGKQPGTTGAELLTMAMAGMSSLDAEQPEGASSIGDVVKRRFEQLAQIALEREKGNITLTGFPTGVDVLDEKIGGWQPGIVSIVAARPGMGKSALALATADAASSKGFGVHLFSLEDTESSYADRAMSRTSGVPAEALRNSDLNRGQIVDLTHTVVKLKKRAGWIVDGRSGVSAQEIVRSVRRHKRTNGTKIVLVDYIQLVARAPRMSGHEALSESITAFADAAKQDGIAYVVMSQLNREIEKRDDKRPQLSDLRESGSLEERAKCVVGLYRGSVYGQKPKRGVDYPQDGHEPSQVEFEAQAQCIVLKNSNGRTGTVRCAWNGPTTKLS